MNKAQKAITEKNIQLIEELKAEIVDSTAGVLKALAKDDHTKALDSLSNTLIGTYLLGKKLGVEFSRLDQQVTATLEQTVGATLAGPGLEIEMKELLLYLRNNKE